MNKLKAKSISNDNPLKLLKPRLKRVFSKIDKQMAEQLNEFDCDINTAHVVLKLTLLQALYSIDNSEDLFQLYKYNLLFKWFMESIDIHQSLTISDYETTQRILKDRQITNIFLQSIVEYLEKRDQKASRIIVSWLQKYCPSLVYFEEFSNSPIESVQLIMRFSPESEEAITPESFYEYGKNPFPRYFDYYEGFEEMMDEEELDHMIENFPEDIEISDNEGYNVSFNEEVISLSKTKPYENWEPYYERLLKAIDICKKCDEKTTFSEVSLLVHNSFEFDTTSVDPADYLTCIPKDPQNVHLPRIMQEKGLKYSFPKLKAGYLLETTLSYENEPTDLYFSIRAGDPHGNWERKHPPKFSIDLSICASRIEKTKLDEIPNLANNLKEKVYIAFHTLITNETRKLMNTTK